MSETDGARRVLLIGGAENERDILRTLLERDRFRILEAADAETGLRLALEERPDVIITELAAAADGDGDVVRRLRALPQTAATPILVHSAWVFPEDEERARAAGATSFLAKPADPHDVADEVRRLLNGGARTD